MTQVPVQAHYLRRATPAGWQRALPWLATMGDDAIAALRARHAQDRGGSSGLPPISAKKKASPQRGGSRSPTKQRRRRSRKSADDSDDDRVSTPRMDAHKALLEELAQAPGQMTETQQISSGLMGSHHAAQMEFHDQGRAAIRETIGLRAATTHRRLAGHREAKRDPAKAFSGLGGLATRHKRSPPDRSPPRRLEALPNSPVPDEAPPLAKGDEVQVWPEGSEKRGTPMIGVVQAIWQSRRTTLVVNRVVIPAPRRREVLVRFEIGAQWVSEENLELFRHPSEEQLRNSIKDLDPDLTTTLGRSLWTQINDGPDGKGTGEDGGYMPSTDDDGGDRLLISSLISGKSPPRKKQLQGKLVKERSLDGESVLTPAEKQMFQAVMLQGVSLS
jgi:hypothetical protein